MSINRSKGVTLIELMIVVVIIGIVTAIVLPAYRTYVQTSERTAAEADLLELAQFMERRFSQGFDYRDGGAAPALPFTRTPRNSAAGSESYQLGFQGNVTQNTFTLQAVPVNAQADEPCGTLTIDNLGNRASTGTGQGCW